MRSFLSLFLSITTAFSTGVAWGQTTAQDQDEVIRVRSNEVRLDVVVKDKKGRPVKDLKATDFEVLEDGVPQKVESFRFVTREAIPVTPRSEEHTSELQSRRDLVCRL